MNTAKERDKALAKARAYARSGNVVWAEHFIRHADAFDYVSPRRIANVRKLYKESEAKRP